MNDGEGVVPFCSPYNHLLTLALTYYSGRSARNSTASMTAGAATAAAAAPQLAAAAMAAAAKAAGVGAEESLGQPRIMPKTEAPMLAAEATRAAKATAAAIAAPDTAAAPAPATTE